MTDTEQDKEEDPVLAGARLVKEKNMELIDSGSDTI
jgi:hypothetical protein